MWMTNRNRQIPTADEALPGRQDAMAVAERHRITGNRLAPPYPDNLDSAVFALGCFWGAERIFWQLPGVWSTAVGYAGGSTPNPTYEEACSGRTGHAEAVLVVFDPQVISYPELLKAFWEAHDPTQGMRQGNDVGTQYRSGIYVANDAQMTQATASRQSYDLALSTAGFTPITTEVAPLDTFYFAEDYHQQYLDKNPNGYCGLGSTGVTCQVGLTT